MQLLELWKLLSINQTQLYNYTSLLPWFKRKQKHFLHPLTLSHASLHVLMSPHHYPILYLRTCKTTNSTFFTLFSSISVRKHSHYPFLFSHSLYQQQMVPTMILQESSMQVDKPISLISLLLFSKNNDNIPHHHLSISSPKPLISSIKER
jgi:hypothetical protein